MLSLLTTRAGVVRIKIKVKAQSLLKERHQIKTDAFVELRVWRVPSPVRGSRHDLKYRLAYVLRGKCVLRYDNEAGKGDHVHSGAVERPYAFTSPEALLADFWCDVDQWRPE